jgi:glutaredoxin
MKRALVVVLLGLGALSSGGCGGSVPPASTAARARVRVTLYTTRWCPVCAHARGWLRSRGIPYRELDVETDGAAAAVHRRLNPNRTVPVFDIEGRVLVGFVEGELRGAIDTAAHRNCLAHPDVGCELEPE